MCIHKKIIILGVLHLTILGNSVTQQKINWKKSSILKRNFYKKKDSITFSKIMNVKGTVFFHSGEHRYPVSGPLLESAKNLWCWVIR
jgi:hypothetical protein